MLGAKEPKPVSETDRLLALEAMEILDSGAEEAFDRVTRLAADLFDAPMAAITFVDAEREWFKSRLIPSQAEVLPRAGSFSEHAIARSPRSVLEDAQTPGRFQAGALLSTEDGHNLGVLSIIDDRPRPPLTALETRRLQTLASFVMDALELRRARRHAADVQHTLDLLERVVRGAAEPAPVAEPRRRKTG
jgi:GAF domain-containing protein